MKGITRAIQIVFALALACCLILGIVFQNRAGDLASEVADPASDPKYASVAGLSFADQYLHPDQAVVREFWAATREFNRAEDTAIYERREWLDKRDSAFVIAVPLGLLLIFVCLPWETWLRQGSDNVERNVSGMIKAARSRIDTNSEKTQIVRRDGLTHYSVADEMLKWKQLRDDGIVTDAEFEEAKAKLLGRKAESA